MQGGVNVRVSGRAGGLGGGFEGWIGRLGSMLARGGFEGVCVRTVEVVGMGGGIVDWGVGRIVLRIGGGGD